MEGGRKSNSILNLYGHTVRYKKLSVKFSPVHSTGQQFAFAASANGGCVLWDLTTGEKVFGFFHNLFLVFPGHNQETKGSLSWPFHLNSKFVFLMKLY